MLDTPPLLRDRLLNICGNQLVEGSDAVSSVFEFQFIVCNMALSVQWIVVATLALHETTQLQALTKTEPGWQPAAGTYTCRF